jgi:hypothetical protein
MLSSSLSKIHYPGVTGVSTRPTDRLQHQRTAKHECCLWVPRTRSRHATCRYSWMRPPSRSRRNGRMTAPERGRVPPSGGR